MAKPIKQRMADGEQFNGCFVELFSPIAAEIVCGAGYDSIMIDLEHGPGSYTDAVAMMQAAGQYGCMTLIRTSSASVTDIKRTMDIGPDGIMVPMVNTADQAEQVVKSCHYAPRGFRSSAKPIIRATGYGDRADDYERYLVEDFLLIVQIESAEAADNVEAIAGVDGIDMLFVGPYDLSCSLGIPGLFDDELFNRTLERIEKAARDAGKLLGIIPIPGRDAARQFANGHNLVITGTDTMLLKAAALDDVVNANRSKI